MTVVFTFIKVFLSFLPSFKKNGNEVSLHNIISVFIFCTWTHPNPWRIPKARATTGPDDGKGREYIVKLLVTGYEIGLSHVALQKKTVSYFFKKFLT